MAKVGFTKLGLKVNQKVEIIEYKNLEIEVLQYLPVQDKYDLLMITLQKANEDGIFNRFKMDVFFHLNLVYLYTNLSFTDKQREDEELLYDKLESNGIIDAVCGAIPEEEYNYLFETMGKMAKDQMKYGNSAGQIIKRVVADLPAQAEAMKEILDSFDPERYQQAINFAKAVNNGALPIA